VRLWDVEERTKDIRGMLMIRRTATLSNRLPKPMETLIVLIICVTIKLIVVNS
jgi:hypothetical protein